MVYLNSASRSRNAGQIVNQCQGGGPKKYGLIPREAKPAAVHLAHRTHYLSLSQSQMMKPHQMNVTANLGIGRRPHGVRFSAWNTNGTSAKVCSMNAIVGA
jgi:hypothetical protein